MEPLPLFVLDDRNFLGYWLVVFCSWLHHCLHKFWMFLRSLLTRRAIIPAVIPSAIPAARILPLGFSLSSMRVFCRWTWNPIDCVNGLVRAAWKWRFVYISSLRASKPLLRQELSSSSASWILASGRPRVSRKY
jgi:hypothetical protein